MEWHWWEGVGVGATLSFVFDDVDDGGVLFVFLCFCVYSFDFCFVDSPCRLSLVFYFIFWYIPGYGPAG